MTPQDERKYTVEGMAKMQKDIRDQLTKLTLQEAKDEETRFKNMQDRVIVDLCGKYGKVKEEYLEE